MSESEIKRTLQSLLPGTRYSVRARAYNNYNVYSEWSEALEFVTPEDDGVPGPVTAISSSFTSPDLILSWDAPALNVDGTTCNDIAYYKLQVTGYAGVIRTYKSINESFQLTYATQKKDFNTPIPNPNIVISVVDTANNESTPVSTDPLNLAPSQPSAPVVDAIPGALSVVMSSAGVEDFYYFILQVSQNGSTWSNLYSGADDNYHHAVAGGLTRYYRYKVVDRFGQESDYSSSVSATAISLASTHSHYLEDLIDVNATPNEGDVLYWDGAFWSATPGGGIGGGGGGPSAEYLNDLLDVDTTSGLSSGKVLKYNGSQWVPQTDNTVSALDDLTDVDTTGLATDKILKYNGSLWVPQPENVTSYLNELLDVDTAGESFGDVLSFNGTNWVPLAIGSGDGLVAISSFPPATPSNGALWWDSDIGTLSVYYQHSGVWVEVSGGGGSSGSGSAYISPDPPATPSSGQFWFDEDTGSTYLYYDTATPSPVWVEVGGTGGSGLTWTQVVNETGTTDTNWTANNGTGTWSSDGTSINQSASIGSAWGALYLKHDANGSSYDSIRTSMTIYEAEMQCPSGGLVGLTFSRRYSDDSSGQIVYYLDIDNDALKVATFGLSNLLNDSVTFSPNTWYKLRMVMIGSSMDLYYDNGSGLTYRASIFVQDEGGNAFKFGLAVFGGTAKFRNIKAWNANLTLPT